MAQPEIAILVSSFERPEHVLRVLASIAAQRGVQGSFEVVVTDDGSRDETARVVRRFAARASFPVQFTTHPHDGFQLARCRNEGVAASTAPYLLFLDGDCIIPPDHLRAHLDHRRPSLAMAGYPIHLSRAATEQVTDEDVNQGRYQRHVSPLSRIKMRWRHLRASMYSLIGHPDRPKLLGGNLGIARTDYERVNGYDENFLGWGCEDDDLRLRLRTAGVSVASIAWWTNTYHLWHPKTPSAPATWRAGPNVDYLRRPLRLMRCLSGLTKRRLQDLHVEIVGRRPGEALESLLPLWCRVAAKSWHSSARAEIEIVFAGSGSAFSNCAECRVLVVPEGHSPAPGLVRHADLVFANSKVAEAAPERVFPLRAFDGVMQRQLGQRRPFERRVLSVA
jgi:glycosyltransferase involved in cell wall biosynthesis